MRSVSHCAHKSAVLIMYTLLRRIMKSQKVTYKQMMAYIAELEMQLKNTHQAVYDTSQLLTDYLEMRGKSKSLERFMRNKYLGCDAEIPTRWSLFVKSIKDRYLRIKKKLDY